MLVWCCPRWARQSLQNHLILWAHLIPTLVLLQRPRQNPNRTLARLRPRSPRPLCRRRKRKVSSPRAGSSSESSAPARKNKSSGELWPEGFANCTFSCMSVWARVCACVVLLLVVPQIVPGTCTCDCECWDVSESRRNGSAVNRQHLRTCVCVCVILRKSCCYSKLWLRLVSVKKLRIRKKMLLLIIQLVKRNWDINNLLWYNNASHANINNST